MTWLGKILTFAVLLAAVAGMYFTVQAYVTRTNWKDRADRLEVALRASEDSRKAEAAKFEARSADLSRQLANASKEVTDLKASNVTLSVARAKADEKSKEYQASFARVDRDIQKLEANLKNADSQAATVRDRNTTLENNAVALQVEAENARREAVRANNFARLTQALADESARKVEDLTARLDEIKTYGGSAAARVLGKIDRPAAPVLQNLRGEVLDVAGDLLTVSVGIDSGLSLNTVLDVYRLDGGGTYLGTVKVTDVRGLYPKQAVVTFTPKAGSGPVERLPASALPKKGDLIKPRQ